MSLLSTLFATDKKTKAAIAKDATYDAADERLRKLEAEREQMRQRLSAAIKHIIED